MNLHVSITSMAVFWIGALEALKVPCKTLEECEREFIYGFPGGRSWGSGPNGNEYWFRENYRDVCRLNYNIYGDFARLSTSNNVYRCLYAPIRKANNEQSANTPIIFSSEEYSRYSGMETDLIFCDCETRGPPAAENDESPQIKNSRQFYLAKKTGQHSYFHLIRRSSTNYYYIIEYVEFTDEEFSWFDNNFANRVSP